MRDDIKPSQVSSDDQLMISTLMNYENDFELFNSLCFLHVSPSFRVIVIAKVTSFLLVKFTSFLSLEVVFYSSHFCSSKFTLTNSGTLVEFFSFLLKFPFYYLLHYMI